MPGGRNLPLAVEMNVSLMLTRAAMQAAAANSASKKILGRWIPVLYSTGSCGLGLAGYFLGQISCQLKQTLTPTQAKNGFSSWF
jgi:carbohydrate-selective porin OprB